MMAVFFFFNIDISFSFVLLVLTATGKNADKCFLPKNLNA